MATQTDILVILYPNNGNDIEGVFILDPYDGKFGFYKATTLEEVRQI